MGLDVDRSYTRSIRADMARAKRDVVAKVGPVVAAGRLDDHRAGLHTGKAWKHEGYCWACRARCERDRRR